MSLKQWFFKFNFNMFLERWIECQKNLKKWSKKDREDFLRDMKIKPKPNKKQMMRLNLMEKKTTIKVPEAYLPLLEDIRLLQSDQNNPNVTTIKQQEQIWKSLQKYGWTYPIVTNKEGVSLMASKEPKVCIAAWRVFCSSSSLASQ